MSKGKKKKMRAPGRSAKAACACDMPGGERGGTGFQPEAPADDVPRALEYRTVYGLIDTDLYERLLKPAFVSFDQSGNDAGLHEIAESVVTAIAMRDAYGGYRKIDDICQRYLYYYESYHEMRHRTWESVELGGLCDYWRSQVFLTFIHDSDRIFQLLLPDVEMRADSVRYERQEAFVDAVSSVLCPSLDVHAGAGRSAASSSEIYDFVHGVSFPWLGYDPENVFRITGRVDDVLDVPHTFAIASREVVERFARVLPQCLEEYLFYDFLYAQHRKLYDAVCEAFGCDSRISGTFREQLSRRVRFDATYQSACVRLLSGGHLTGSLHRSSRVSVGGLNLFSDFASTILHAARARQGVYLFHYRG